MSGSVLRYGGVFLGGLAFGVVLIKGRIASWSRIQEMFWFESFHMYGVIGTAVIVGALSIYCIKKYKIKTIYGEEIMFTNKDDYLFQLEMP